jgi:hypothetical protein
MVIFSPANSSCLQELRRVQHVVESLDASVASLEASIAPLRASIASIQALVAKQWRQIRFLHGNRRELGAIHEDPEARGYDTDPDDAESFSGCTSMKSLVCLSPVSTHDSSATAAQSSDTVQRNRPTSNDRSLATISMASDSMRSLCATTSINMIIAPPSTGPVASIDPLATPPAPTIRDSTQPQVIFNTPPSLFGLPRPDSDDYLTGAGGQYAYVRVTEDLIENVSVLSTLDKIGFLIEPASTICPIFIPRRLGHGRIELSDVIV